MHRRVLVIVFAACSSSSNAPLRNAGAAEATVAPGAIEGVVTDNKGSPLAHVSVAIDSNSTYTDDNGAWALSKLLPGPYTLDVLALNGLTQLDVTIEAGRTTHFEVRLDEAEIKAREVAATPMRTLKAECIPSAIELRLGASSDAIADCGLITSITTTTVWVQTRDCIVHALEAQRPFRFADDSYGYGLVSLPSGDSYQINVFDGSDIGDRTIHGTIRHCQLVVRPHPPPDCKDDVRACLTCKAMVEVPGCVVPP